MPLPWQHIRRVPRHVIWEITKACNLRCLHCEGSAGTRDPDELTTQETLALCGDLAAAGCRTCNVSGGEPLLRRDWEAICAALASRGVRVTLVTNGTLLDDAAIARAARAGVVAAAVSLDGLEATHDRIRPAPSGAGSSFAKATAALERLAGTPLKSAAITHLNRWNLDEIERIHALLGAAGVAVWQVQLGLPLGRLREVAEPYMLAPAQLAGAAARIAALKEEGRPPRIRVTDTIGYYTPLEPALRGEGGRGRAFWTGCYAGMLTAGIESNGDVKGCSSMPPEFTAGSVRKERFADIWADEARFAYNTRWREEKLTGFCATCAMRRLCRAGCTTLAYAVTGTIWENPYCLHRVAAAGGEKA